MFPQIHHIDYGPMPDLLEHLQNAVIDGADVNEIVAKDRNILENIICKGQATSDIFRFLTSCNAKIDNSKPRILVELFYSAPAYIIVDCGIIKSTDLLDYPMLFLSTTRHVDLFRYFIQTGGDPFMIYGGESIIMYLCRCAQLYSIHWISLIIAGLIVSPKIIRTLYDDEQIPALYSLNL
jgi:hypothetical protein